jgi:prolyl-tRNA editing enzyme YbaK/EbsC (Cys-tRNA(Pro) deacylase)
MNTAAIPNMMEGEKSKSVLRVAAAAKTLGLDIQITRLPASTRTAQEAAAACGCAVAQIVKSLVFAGVEGEEIGLFLVSGAHPLSAVAAEDVFGQRLKRADARTVREQTGFAIGGVAPIGHLSRLSAYFDAYLLDYDVVWAAAGAPNAVFSVNPRRLADAVGAVVHQLGQPGVAATSGG